MDELIRTRQAHNALLNLKKLDEDELDKIRTHYGNLEKPARDNLSAIEDGFKDLHHDEGMTVQPAGVMPPPARSSGDGPAAGD